MMVYKFEEEQVFAQFLGRSSDDNQMGSLHNQLEAIAKLGLFLFYFSTSCPFLLFFSFICVLVCV
jgi:hypothetical protein